MNPSTGLQTAFGRFVLMAAATLVACGCNDAKKKIESSDNLKQLSVAIIAYHDAHNAYPDSLDQLKPMIGQKGPIGVIGNGKDYAALIRNPLTGDDPGYEYVKPGAEGNESTTIVLYQLRNGKRDTSLPVAYANGSVAEAK